MSVAHRIDHHDSLPGPLDPPASRGRPNPDDRCRAEPGPGPPSPDPASPVDSPSSPSAGPRAPTHTGSPVTLASRAASPRPPRLPPFSPPESAAPPASDNERSDAPLFDNRTFSRPLGTTFREGATSKTRKCGNGASSGKITIPRILGESGRYVDFPQHPIWILTSLDARESSFFYASKAQFCDAIGASPSAPRPDETRTTKHSRPDRQGEDPFRVASFRPTRKGKATEPGDPGEPWISPDSRHAPTDSSGTAASVSGGRPEASVRGKGAQAGRSAPRLSPHPQGPAHQAFMNQKIMPRSATRELVTGTGRPARKYQSLPRCVRRPGVRVTLVELPSVRGVFATAER